MEEADLIGQLSTLKDYFLLGRGELFLAFIDQSQTLLNTPPMKHTEHGKEKKRKEKRKKKKERMT